MTEMVTTRSHEIFCVNLRRLITSRRMTQTFLAAKMGVTPPYISQIISGRSVPTLDVVDRIANALECEPFELLRPLREKTAV